MHIGNTVADIERAFSYLPEGLEGNSGEPDYAYSYEESDSSLIFYTHEDGTI